MNRILILTLSLAAPGTAQSNYPVGTRVEALYEVYTGNTWLPCVVKTVYAPGNYGVSCTGLDGNERDYRPTKDVRPDTGAAAAALEAKRKSAFAPGTPVDARPGNTHDWMACTVAKAHLGITEIEGYAVEWQEPDGRKRSLNSSPQSVRARSAAMTGAAEKGRQEAQAYANSSPGRKVGSREPENCAGFRPKGAAPTGAEAAKLVRCQWEKMSQFGELTLLENLSVQIGEGRRRNVTDFIPDISARSLVYPIRGVGEWYYCEELSRARAGENCRVTKYGDLAGRCWIDTFGEWKCGMTGVTGETRHNVAPPQAR